MTSNSSPAVTTCVLVSDFNAGNLGNFLQAGDAAPALRVVMPDYGQVIPTLLDAGQPCWQENADVALIWTRPEAVIASFAELLQGETIPLDTLLAEVDAYAAHIVAAADRVRTTVVPTWTRPVGDHGLGPIDLRPGGTGHALLHMNARLLEQLQPHASIYVLDSSPWVAAQAHPAMAYKFWYASKTPYTTETFREAARQVRALVRATRGRSSKLLILDLDDTLWGGIVGDVGREHLRLGGHDPVGEAFQDFQRGIKALQKRGVILAVVSKNDEAVALDAIDNHPEMLIRREDLAGWRINWNDKAQNIIELVDELNLGLDAAVFIDDNPAERGRVGEAIPELLVPDWPADKLQYRYALNQLDCFDTVSVSSEDAARSRSYAAERERSKVKAAMNMDEWLESLELKVRVARLSADNLQRATQLLNKTNQMNLSTRRLTEAELQAWAAQPGHAFYTFWVSDRFGDSGLTGLLGTECTGSTCRIVDFVLSCRVFGRQVENVMAAVAAAEARDNGATTVEALFVPTAKNRPTLDFFSERSGFSVRDEHRFVWDADSDYPLPGFIDVSRAGPDTPES